MWISKINLSLASLRLDPAHAGGRDL